MQPHMMSPNFTLCNRLVAAELEQAVVRYNTHEGLVDLQSTFTQTLPFPKFGGVHKPSKLRRLIQ